MAAITKALIGEDLSAEMQNECSAHLDSLMALADSKAEYYAEKIKTSLLGAGLGTDKTFPITVIKSFIFQTKAYTSDSAKNISDVVNNSIKGFVDGKNQEAVATLLSGFVEMLFGSTEGAEQQVFRYCAFLEGAMMVRFDFAGWSRSVKSTALKTKCDKVSCFVLYRSNVDMAKVSLNDFIEVYQYTVIAENKDKDKAMDTVDIIKKCQEIYKAFHPQAVINSNYEILPTSLDIEEQFEPSIGHKDLNVFQKNLITL